jgi:hypothetical protein
MEMTQSSSFFQLTRSSAAPYGAAIYTHPSDVTSNAKLTTAEKRAVLASWISDAHAVENAPSLRRLDSGAVVEVDAILQALVLLDEQAPDRRENGKRLNLSGRRRSVLSRWMKRVSPSKGSNDNDDDPPPAPAGFGMPFRPLCRGLWASGLKARLACATGRWGRSYIFALLDRSGLLRNFQATRIPAYYCLCAREAPLPHPLMLLASQYAI